MSAMSPEQQPGMMADTALLNEHRLQFDIVQQREMITALLEAIAPICGAALNLDDIDPTEPALLAYRETDLEPSSIPTGYGNEMLTHEHLKALKTEVDKIKTQLAGAYWWNEQNRP